MNTNPCLFYSSMVSLKQQETEKTKSSFNTFLFLFRTSCRHEVLLFELTTWMERRRRGKRVNHKILLTKGCGFDRNWKSQLFSRENHVLNHSKRKHFLKVFQDQWTDPDPIPDRSQSANSRSLWFLTLEPLMEDDSSGHILCQFDPNVLWQQGKTSSTHPSWSSSSSSAQDCFVYSSFPSSESGIIITSQIKEERNAIESKGKKCEKCKNSHWRSLEWHIWPNMRGREEEKNVRENIGRRRKCLWFYSKSIGTSERMARMRRRMMHLESWDE